MPDQSMTNPLPEVDMSPEAIDQRLRDVAQLYRLGISLRDAQVLGPVEELRRKEKQPPSRPESVRAKTNPA